MRSAQSSPVAALILLLAACTTGPSAAGWRGSNVHLVDGTWIGTETACGDGDDAIECRTVVEQAVTALAPDIRSKVTRAVLADLPTTYVTAAGETRTARLAAGIATRKAVVIELDDGTRRVIGLWCHLPYSGNGGGLMVRDVDCGNRLARLLARWERAALVPARHERRLRQPSIARSAAAVCAPGAP
jgi:hypothetical protein